MYGGYVLSPHSLLFLYILGDQNVDKMRKHCKDIFSMSEIQGDNGNRRGSVTTRARRLIETRGETKKKSKRNTCLIKKEEL